MKDILKNTNTVRTDYLYRINRVMDYIEAHLDENLTLETLSHIACFSRFHFHRIFQSVVTLGEVGKMQLPGGKYAVCRFVLGPGDYPAAWGWMYGTWFPLSGYQPDDRIAFEWFIPQNQQKNEEKISVEICIPVKPAGFSNIS